MRSRKSAHGGRRDTNASQPSIELKIDSNSPGMPGVLCVDDDTTVLDAAQRILGRRYAVTTTTSAAKALDLVASGKFAVLVSDYHMPEMNGVELLSRARDICSDTVQVLLSGTADLNAAVGAINEGRLFRFVLKPCEAALLVNAVDAAAEQHRLVVAERELLEQTVSGSVAALVDLLAITQPAAFGRAARLRRLVEHVAVKRGITSTWALGVAAQLSQVGFIIVPPDTTSKVNRGAPLTPAEQELMERLMPFAERLVGGIPRLEPVRAIIRMQYDTSSSGNEGDEVREAAKILRAARMFDMLEIDGSTTTGILRRLLDDGHDAGIVAAIGECRGVSAERRANRARTGSGGQPVNHLRPVDAIPFDTVHPDATRDTATRIQHQSPEPRRVPLSDVLPGMTFVSDVVTTAGVLLVARGQVVSESLVARIAHSWHSFARDILVEVSDEGQVVAPHRMKRAV